ncbi:MAG: hypothetical protein KME57_16145 [Scytonema hyalinum WJT4-NPBG1]|nr:hypothetical protein [Scytonema hyalinum WJT4-NPBG1]
MSKVVSPLAHLIQDGLAFATPLTRRFRDNPNWGSIRKSVPELGSVG